MDIVVKKKCVWALETGIKESKLFWPVLQRVQIYFIFTHNIQILLLVQEDYDISPFEWVKYENLTI